MRLLAPLALLALVAGCASAPRNAGTHHPAKAAQQWSGRLSLQIMSEPVQNFSAGFTLEGQAQAGRLTLTSPLGNTLAVLHWSPDWVQLHQGNRTQNYASLDEMTEAITGAPLPVLALFSWLNGQAQDAPGWTADLSRASEKRLSALRQMPLPAAELRVVLDP